MTEGALPAAAVCLLAIPLIALAGCSNRANDAANVPAARPVDNAAGLGGQAGAPAAPADAGPLPPPVAIFPPVEWSVPDGALPDTSPVAGVVDVGGNFPLLLFDGCRDRYLTYTQVPDRSSPAGKLVYQFQFGSFDPVTGKPIGQRVPLAAECDFKQALGYVLPMRADVSPSGVLAIQVSGKIPETIGKVAVLEPAAETLRTLAALPSFNKWFAWTAGNRLLVIRDGQLHFWDPKADAAALTVGEKLDLPAAISPARNWVVATVDGKYLEIFDAATGEVRGRLGPEGDWLYLAISPDGRRMAGVRYAGGPRQPSTSPVHERHDVHVWQLDSGEQIATFSTRSYGPPVYWAGPNHVLHDGKVWDLDTLTPTVALNMPQHSKGAVIPVGSPDGRSWWSVKTGQAFAVQIPLQPAGGKPAFDRQTPVKIELDSGDVTHDAELREAIATVLGTEGRPAGSGDWKLRVSTKQIETLDQLIGNQTVYRPPGLEGTVAIVAPDGSTAATVSFGGTFSKYHTAYLVRTVRNDPFHPDTVIYEYDFRGKDPRQAILEECWVKAVDMLRSIKRLPTVWEVNGKYLPLPVPVTLALPEGVRK
ncbi:MAG TPA: hypothetical protein VJ783_28065 [Pirellulales bacterium]|nr:hypothetical protein [Pirellulales bacterium]